MKSTKKKKNKKNLKYIFIAGVLVLSILDTGAELIDQRQSNEKKNPKNDVAVIETEKIIPLPGNNDFGNFDPNSIPDYNGEPFAIVNDGLPYFTEDEITDVSYISLGDLDSLGRCTAATACLGPETMPEDSEERGEIGNVKPTGWCQNKYDCVNGKYVVNRCHMIGWLLSGLNDDERNLITGTRYLNLSMLEFEEMVARYIEETGNHVMYRATPVFGEGEMLARGLLLEGYSVEDKGKEICFNLYFYNVQPGIEFDYRTGENWYTGEFLDTDSPAVVAE